MSEQAMVEPQDALPAEEAGADEAVTEATETLDDALAIFDEAPEPSDAVEPEAEGELGEPESTPSPEGGEPDPEEGEEGEPAKPEPSRFEMVQATDEEEESVEDFDLPEGAKIRFKADRKQVEVESMDDLVAMAQKGVAFDRMGSEWGQERQHLTERLSSATEQVETMQGRLEHAEQILMKALFDDEARAKMAEAAEDFRNPEVVEGRRAKARLAEKEKEDEARREREAAEASEEFWGEVRQGFDEILEEGGLEYLRPEDRDLVVNGVYGVYQSFLEGTKNELVQEHGLDEQEATERAARVAMQWLAEEEAETLRAVAEQLNEVYRSRLGPNGDGSRATPEGTRESDPKRDPDQHNKRTDQKLSGRKKSTLRGVGATPSGSRGRQDADPRDPGTTYDDVWGEIDQMFEEAQKGE